MIIVCRVGKRLSCGVGVTSYQEESSWTCSYFSKVSCELYISPSILNLMRIWSAASCKLSWQQPPVKFNPGLAAAAAATNSHTVRRTGFRRRLLLGERGPWYTASRVHSPLLAVTPDTLCDQNTFTFWSQRPCFCHRPMIQVWCDPETRNLDKL